MTEQVRRLAASTMQRSLWALHRRRGELGALNYPLIVELHGPIDPDLVRDVVDAVIARHESLRTVFESHAGRLEQRIEPRMELQLPAEPVDEQALDGELTRERSEPIDPSNRAWRARLLRLSAERSCLCFTMHHLVADAWSAKVITDELAAGLAGRQPARRPWQYRHYLEWRRRQTKLETRERDYWEKLLRPLAPSSLVTHDLEAWGPTRSMPIPLELDLRRARELAARQGHTVVVLTMAAWLQTLAAVQATTTPLVSTTLSVMNRPRAELLHVVGPLANLLIIPLEVRPSDELPHVCRLLGSRLREAEPWSGFSYPTLRPRPEPGRLDDIAFQYLPALPRRRQYGAVELEVVTPRLESRFPLELVMIEDAAKVRSELRWQPSVVRDDTAQALASGFARTLARSVPAHNQATWSPDEHAGTEPHGRRGL